MSKPCTTGVQTVTITSIHQKITDNTIATSTIGVLNVVNS
jgi:hypothetical protein